MYCEFSETQFVFGILNELVTCCWTPDRAWAAPIFPTQRREMKSGYDFTIEGPIRTLFFQFKVPEKKTTWSGDDKHDICYTIEPPRICKMHSSEYSIKTFDIEELKKDAESANPYENIKECMNKIEEEFSIDTGNVDNTVERFYKITNQLLMSENLNLLLLGK